MLKTFPSDKIDATENVLFLRNPTHHGFTFNFQFLYELKHKVCLSKTVCRIFHFGFLIISIKVYIFCSKKCINSLILKGHNSFQN